MAQQYDGSIRIGVDVDFSDMAKSTEEIRQRLEGVKGALERAEKTLVKTFDGKLVNSTAVAIENARQKVAALTNEYQDLLFSDQPPKSVLAMERELTKLEAQIRKADAEFEKLAAEQSALAAKDITINGVSGLTADEKARFQELDNLIIKNGYTVDDLNSRITLLRKNIAEIKANPAISSEAKKLALRLDEAVIKLEGLNQKAAAAGTNISSEAKKAGKSIKKATDPKPVKALNNEIKKSGSFVNQLGGHFQRLGTRILNTVKSALLFSVLYSALGKLREEIGKVLKTNTMFSANLEQIKNNLKAAFYPIYTAILPALNALMAGIAKVTAMFASFINAIFGKTPEESLKAANSLFAYADALDKVKDKQDETEKTTKKLDRSLAGFDKLNILSSGQSSDGNIDSNLSDLIKAKEEAEKNDQNALFSNYNLSVFDKIKENLTEIKELFSSGFWDAFTNVDFGGTETGLEGVKNALMGIVEDAISIGYSLKNIFSDPSLVDSANNLAQSTITALGQIAGSAAVIGIAVAKNLTGGVEKFLNNRKQELVNSFSAINNAAAEAVAQVGRFSTAIANIGSVSGSESAQQLTANILSIFSDAGLGVVELGAKYGRDFIHGITEPIIQNQEPIKEAFNGLISFGEKITDTLSKVSKVLWADIQELYDEHIKPVFDAVTEQWSKWVNTIVTGWNEHVQPVLDNFAKKFEEIAQEKIIPAIDSLKEGFGKLFDGFGAVWENIIGPFVNYLLEKLMPAIATVMDNVGKQILNIIDVISILADGLGQVAGGIGDIIKGIAELDLKTVLNGIKEVISGFFDAILRLFENFVNGIIQLLNKMPLINIPEANFSSLMTGKTSGKSAISNGYNSKLGALMTSIDARLLNQEIKIPALARGAVIPPNSEFLALLGDQKHGVNIEAPLQTIVEAFRQAQGDQNGTHVNVSFNGSLAALGRVLKPVITQENIRVGDSFAAGGVY